MPALIAFGNGSVHINLLANRIVQFAVGEPGNVVEVRGNPLRFIDMERDHQSIDARLEVVFHMRE